MPSPTTTSAVSARQFGLEIEFSGGQFSHWRRVLSRLFETNPAFRTEWLMTTEEYRHSDGSRWELKRDGSCGWELATPAMTWAHWPLVEQVLTTLRENNATITRNCGLHVHHEIREFSLASLRRLTVLWAITENTMFSLVAPTRRGNSYCSPLAATIREINSNSRSATAFRAWLRERGRHRAMNLTNWWRRGTMEIRTHHGSLDADEIRWWTLFTQALCDVAAHRIRVNTLKQLAESRNQLDQLKTIILTYRKHPDVVKVTDVMVQRAKEFNAVNSRRPAAPPRIDEAQIRDAIATWTSLARLEPNFDGSLVSVSNWNI